MGAAAPVGTARRAVRFDPTARPAVAPYSKSKSPKREGSAATPRGYFLKAGFGANFSM